MSGRRRGAYGILDNAMYSEKDEIKPDEICHRRRERHHVYRERDLLALRTG